MTRIERVFAAWVVSSALGCSDTTTSVSAGFDMPTGLAVAGTASHRLFVSNTAQDTVQVVELGKDLSELDFVNAPARRFPLRIPAGMGPGDLAATFDHRFVVVLDLISRSLRLIDADSLLLVRDPDGAVLQLPLGNSGTRPVAMIASPVACPGECAGRVFVALADAGAVLAVDVLNGTAGPQLVPGAVFVVGGEPSALAINATATTLFATDPSAPTLVRIDVATGTVTRLDIGSAGGPLAVSRDGTMVVVGRPAWRDVLVMGGADGPDLAVVDANAGWAPIPQCVRDCYADGADRRLCVEAHPADAELCAAPEGLLSSAALCAGAGPAPALCSDDPPPAFYPGIYLGQVPARIVTLGESVGHDRLQVPCLVAKPTACKNAGDCASDEVCTSAGVCAKVRTYGEMAAVAQLNGRIVFLGLAENSGDRPTPSLVQTGWCVPPALSKVMLVDPDHVDEGVAAQLSHLLVPCVQTPAERERFTCVTDVAGGGGVVISEGNTGTATWVLSWEGATQTGDTGVIEDVEIDGVSCATDGDCPDGAVCKAPRCVESWFTERLDSLAAAATQGCKTLAGETCTRATADADKARWGDILSISTAAVIGCVTPCADATVRDWRVLERRILAVDDAGEHVRLQLDRYLPASCYPQSGAIRFAIRAGDQFLATRTISDDTEVERLSPGARLGPGGDPDQGDVVDRLRREIIQLQDFGSHPELDSCARYQADGSPQYAVPGDVGSGLLLAEAASRRAALRFTVTDAHAVFYSGFGFTTSGSISNEAAGDIPAGMIVTELAADQAVVFVSYAGSNTLVGLVPFDVASPFKSNARYNLLR